MSQMSQMGQRGLLVIIAPDDYPALVDALQLALSDVKRLRGMGKESYRIVKEEINLEKMVEVFVKALNSLV